MHLLLALSPFVCDAVELDREVPEGWAIYPENKNEGITGGGDGDVVTVSNLSDLTKYSKDSKPYIILIKGTITATDPITVTSNKTLIGLIVVKELYLQGGILKSYTSNPQFRLTATSLSVEDNSQIIAGSVAASEFVLNGTLSGNGNLTKTGVGTLLLKAAAGNYSGAWTLADGNMKLENANVLGSKGISLSGSSDTLFVNADNTTGTFDCAATDILVLNAGLTVNYATLNGKELKAGKYTSADFPSVIAGNGVLTVLMGVEPTIVALNHTDNAFSIVPNPCDDIVVFNTADNNQYAVSIYNQLGQLIATGVAYNGSVIETSSLPKGLYLVEVKNDAKRVVLKLLKK